ncbi:hypothetical protein GCM10010468_32630 [Actinocorallia longicatena]|uniref:RDD domain-containing protein n=1 Tax=Actinocorallia longicatena TaxID=111803 RepID=A0ABP6Q9T2_9ACTN
MSTLAGVVLGLGVFAAIVLVEPLQLVAFGRTVGKRLMRLRIADVANPMAPLTTGRAFGRGLLYPFGFMVIGLIPLLGSGIGLLNVLWQFWDKPYQQTLHDKMAGTVVLADVPVAPESYYRTPSSY